MKSRACIGCGAALLTRRADARACSSTCRNRAARARRARPVPPCMATANRWVRWALRPRGGRLTKVPLTVHGRHASSTRAATWTRRPAAAASRVGAGLGYVLGDGVGCYDLDGALDRGRLKDWARDALAAIPEPALFVEVSQSGTGLHVFVVAPPGPGTVTRHAGGAVERYTTGRYIAMTGVPFDVPDGLLRWATPLDAALVAARR
ncbi:DNA primase [Micrococcus luteus]|nr:DNA primase [Micrococcus luteus]